MYGGSGVSKDIETASGGREDFSKSCGMATVSMLLMITFGLARLPQDDLWADSSDRSLCTFQLPRTYVEPFERGNISSPLNLNLIAEYVSSLVSILSNDKSKLMQLGYVREKAIHA